MNIEHNTSTHRFEIHIDGHTGYLEYQEQGDDVLDFTHTIVAKELGGQGIGSSLVKHGLDYAKKNDKHVIASCSFVDAYIGRHPEYEKLRA